MHKNITEVNKKTEEKASFMSERRTIAIRNAEGKMGTEVKGMAIVIETPEEQKILEACLSHPKSLGTFVEPYIVTLMQERVSLSPHLPPADVLMAGDLYSISDQDVLEKEWLFGYDCG